MECNGESRSSPEERRREERVTLLITITLRANIPSVSRCYEYGRDTIPGVSGLNVEMQCSDFFARMQNQSERTTRRFQHPILEKITAHEGIRYSEPKQWGVVLYGREIATLHIRGKILCGFLR